MSFLIGILIFFAIWLLLGLVGFAFVLLTLHTMSNEKYQKNKIHIDKILRMPTHHLLFISMLLGFFMAVMGFIVFIED